MAKTGNGKLSKLKCMIKRWHSSSRITQSTSSSAGAGRQSDGDTWHSASFNGDEVPAGYRPVYVGKSRRRYLITSDLVEHPIFRNLLESSGSDGGLMVVGCEVVLFEHLLWMLENADPKPESLDEIVEFYAC